MTSQPPTLSLGDAGFPSVLSPNVSGVTQLPLEPAVHLAHDHGFWWQLGDKFTPLRVVPALLASVSDVLEPHLNRSGIELSTLCLHLAGSDVAKRHNGQPVVSNRVNPTDKPETPVCSLFPSPFVWKPDTLGFAATRAGSKQLAGTGRGMRDRSTKHVISTDQPFQVRSSNRRSDRASEPGRSGCQFESIPCFEIANIRTMKGGKMPNKTPLTAQVSMKLMSARMIVHSVFYRDEVIDEQEQSALNEIDAATLDAEAADLARVEAIHVFNHGLTTDWHRRKRRELAKLREMKMASTVAAIEAE